MSFIEPYLGALKAAFIVAYTLGLLWVGHHFTAVQDQSKIDAANAATVTAVNNKEREMQDKVDALTIQAQKDKADAKTKYDSLVKQYSTGARRLSVAVATCTPTGTNPGVGDSQARAELLPANAASVIGVVNDANGAVLDLNECIDKYQAVKDALDPEP